MPRTFQVLRNKVLMGRYSSGQLQEMARTSQLLPTDLIHDPRTGRTTKAASIKVLADVLQPLAQPEAPPLPDVFSVPQDLGDTFQLPTSTGYAPPPPPPPARPQGSAEASLGMPAGTEDDAQHSLSAASILLRVLGGLCVAIGLADFVLYNTRIFDIYGGVPFISGNVAISFFTAMLAIAIGSGLLRTGGRHGSRGSPTPSDYVLGVAGCTLSAIVAVSLLLIAVNGSAWTPSSRSKLFSDQHNALAARESEFVRDFNHSVEVTQEWAAAEAVWVETLEASDDVETQVHATEVYRAAAGDCQRKARPVVLRQAFGGLERALDNLLRSLNGQGINKADECLRDCESAAVRVVAASFEARAGALSNFAINIPDLSTVTLPADYDELLSQLKSTLQECVAACEAHDVENVDRLLGQIRSQTLLLNRSAEENGLEMQ